MKRILGLIAVVALSVAVSGCSLKKPAVKPPASTSDSVATQGASTGSVNGSDVGKGTPLPGAGGATDANALKTTIYFDFDSSEIRPEFTASIVAHGRRLGADHTLKVRLEGNTDERGSAEYNVALGERRAQAVKRALLLQGATDVQLSTVSYGEERPVAPGHDEAAWAQNRRVEIVFLGAR
jgi:peptidoglycan-associated lipoprotein